MPAPTGAPGDGAPVARQLDAALLGVGFAATRELLDHLSALRPDAAMGAAVTIIAAAREMVGDHVEHNAYFRDFPEGVPDTMAFWVDCVVDALAAGDRSAFGRGGVLNLLGLRRYGRYQHSSTALIVRSILARRFLTVGDLVALLGPAGPCRGQAFDGPVTYLGIERPEGLPDGSDVITLDRLTELVPG
ncbi:MAG TPA: hypothetical protein VHS35_01100 [Pseudonocardia sp.]|nr:hypothetical protein [Pseudonocardia sp.]